jgi:hypothetical protein
VGLFVAGSGASSRSAIACLVVNGKKPFDFRELAIDFAHFQACHRQQRDDAGQSHRKSNHMLNRSLHFLLFYHLAAAASTIGAAFPQSNSQSLYELTKLTDAMLDDERPHAARGVGARHAFLSLTPR